MISGTSAPLHITLTFILFSAIAACSDSSDGVSLGVQLSADAPDALGSFGVGHSTFTAIDTLRDNRSLAIDVWYPVDAPDRQDSPLTIYALAPGIGLDSTIAVDNLPVSARTSQNLLIYSHGLGGISTASVRLMETLASHGFIIISPEHTGNSQNSNTQSFDEAARSRVPDVSFLIDTMLQRSQVEGDMFHRRIDADNIGVLGHSFGGMTALGMAAGWAGASPDERVRAIVPISAVIRAQLQKDDRSGEPNAGFSKQQLEQITVPTLLIGGTQDVDVFIENNTIAFMEIINSPFTYQLNLRGANHNHFIAVCDIGNLLINLGINQDSWGAIGAEGLLEPYASTCSPQAFPIEEVDRLLNVYAVAFFRRHLQDDTRYDFWLSADFAEKETNATLSVK